MSTYYQRPLTSDEIYHHGILGQKWGKKNGPPYPLDASDHSSSEQKAGWQSSLNKNSADVNEVKKDATEYSSYKSEQIASIAKKGDALVERANQLGKKYEEEYKKVQLSEKEKQSIKDKLKEDFGKDGADDEEYYELITKDYVSEIVDQKVYDSLAKERVAFNKMQDEYWNDVRSFTQPFLNKYADVKITERNLLGQKKECNGRRSF